ncbi:uncharacterized protein LOC141723962 isoform X2 [Apium graveolens]
MSASVVSEAMVMNSSNATSKNNQLVQTATQSEVESASCDCCGLTEECTQAYIQTIREIYQGKWICGLCAEAVNYEMRIKNKQLDEALIQHMSFCNKFISSSPPPNPAVHLISAMRSILRRSLDSPRSMPSSPSSRHGRGPRGLSRSGSHVPAVSPIDLDESLSRPCIQDHCVEKI